MRRFEVTEVGHGEFKQVCDRLGYEDLSRGGERSALFGTFRAPISYNSIDSATTDFTDEHQDVLPLIPGRKDLVSALNEFNQNSELYREQIAAQANTASIFEVVRITEENLDRMDVFKFFKEDNGLWTLRFINIAGRNFGMYRLRPAIYSANQGRNRARYLKAVNTTP